MGLKLNKMSLFLLNEKVNKIALYIAILLFFCLIYILNYLFPLMADDWGYSFVFSPDGNLKTRVHSISDIFISQYWHYLKWGGRSVVHFIAQTLLFIDIKWARLLNSLAYVCLFTTIYVIINKGKKANAVLFVSINIVMWLIQPAFSVIIIWLTGSSNYLWGALLYILFIYPFYLFYCKRISSDSSLKAILFFLWGIISGWTNENSSLAMIFILVALMGYLKFVNVKIPKWAIWGIMGASLGCAIMLLAPGNGVRSATLEHNLGLLEVSSFKLFKIRLYNLYNAGAVRLLLASLTYVFFVGIFFKWGYTKERISILYSSLIFFVAGLVGFVVLFPLPYIPRDVWTGIHIFWIISIGILYVNISFSNGWLKLGRGIVFLFLVILFVNVYVSSYKNVHYFSAKSKERELFIKEQKTKGIQDIIVLDEMHFPPGILLSEPLSYDESYWTNVLCARYYNINSIRLKYCFE